MFYLDASAAVAAVTEEAHSDRVWQWLTAHTDAALFVSGWVDTEVSSALSIKARTGALTLDQRVSAMESWRRFRASSLRELAVTPDHFESAARFCDRPDLGLRASDALHLAIAASANVQLLTLDERMAEIAPRLGIPVEPL